MKNKRQKRVLSGITLLVILSMVAAGCDKYTRYRALTFFFTGVPPIEEGNISGKQPSKIALKKKKITSSQEIPSFVHGPFGAGQCDLCHEAASIEGPRKSAKEESKKTAFGSLQRLIPQKLVMPLKELCIECHTTKSVETAYNKGLWMHGPVSDGLCTRCHDPHQTPFQYMLLKDKSIDLCTQCHTEGLILKTEDHTKNEECISCHNPHTGRDRFLLKKDYKEEF